MEFINVKTRDGEITFKYKTFFRWFFRSMPFAALAYLICCGLTYYNCYVSYTIAPVNHNVYLYVASTSLIGVLIAVVCNYKNLSLKAVSSFKISREVKRKFRVNFIAVIISSFLYIVILGSMWTTVYSNNWIQNIIYASQNPEMIETFFHIVLSPDIAILSSMIGMFIMYSLTRYLFDKSILA